MKLLLKIIIVLGLMTITCCKTANLKKEDINQVKHKNSLAFELCEIYGLDQGIRGYNLKFNKREAMQAIDTLNFNKIVNFVEKNGFPNKKMLGEENYKIECVEGAAVAVLLHNPYRLVNEEKYFNLFLNEVKKGNLKAEGFAFFLDKYYWTKSKNKKTRRVLYGSQFGKPCIQTKEITNKARLEIGLKPLKDDEFVDCEGEEQHILNERK